MHHVWLLWQLRLVWNEEFLDPLDGAGDVGGGGGSFPIPFTLPPTSFPHTFTGISNLLGPTTLLKNCPASLQLVNFTSCLLFLAAYPLSYSLPPAYPLPLSHLLPPEHPCPFLTPPSPSHTHNPSHTPYHSHTPLPLSHPVPPLTSPAPSPTPFLLLHTLPPPTPLSPSHTPPSPSHTPFPLQHPLPPLTPHPPFYTSFPLSHTLPSPKTTFSLSHPFPFHTPILLSHTLLPPTPPSPSHTLPPFTPLHHFTPPVPGWDARPSYSKALFLFASTHFSGDVRQWQKSVLPIK